MKPIIQLSEVRARYGSDDPDVLRGVSFDLLENEVLALLGPSGCGKTTTLRVIAGFEHSRRGAIHIADRLVSGEGVHVPAEQRGVGFVFQDYALFPHLDVIQNVLFGLHRMPRKERKRRALEVLDIVGLADLAKRAHELSGGQQQRVALARSLAPSPGVILLDEPFSNLDAALRSDTRAEVRAILKKSGMSAILVTHDQEEALTIADRVAVMSHGRIEQVGTPQDVYRRPETAFVARFLGNTNLVRGEANGTRANSPLGPVELDREVSGEVLLSIRPEQLAMESAQGNGENAVILSREYKGHDQLYRVRIGSHELVVMTDHRSEFHVGDTVLVRNTEPAIVLESSVGPSR